MQIYLEECIGNPKLFAGRNKEISLLLTWIDGIKMRVSKSTAILSRRKTGKTALLERLYNLTFERQDQVVPFYIEIQETSQWLGNFARQFFMTFLVQYAAFKTRNAAYLSIKKPDTFDALAALCQEAHLDYLLNLIDGFQDAFQKEHGDRMWDIAREAPARVAAYTGEQVLQMIDEFQFLNRFIFRDQLCMHCIENLAGSYLHTAERKHAPLLITGSWVGWLMDDVNRLLPGRFRYFSLEPMPETEAIEMIAKYAVILNQPVTEETTYLIAQLTEGHPFYISALFDSIYPEKDLTTPDGVRRTLEFETLHLDGSINATWMEYIDSAFPRINEVYAKDMVLYLSKHRHEFVSRKALKEKLHLDMSDAELEKKFRALFRSDIIEEHYGRYRGVQDNIFDKVFRRSYADDIDAFVTEEAPREYKALFDEILAKYRTLQGEYNRYKGAVAEFIIAHHLRDHAAPHQDLFRAMLCNLPEDFAFAEYHSVNPYLSPPLNQPEFQIDLLARAEPGHYSLIIEIKNREAKFSLPEAQAFVDKAQAVIRLEQIEKAVLLVFSAGGFYKNTLRYLEEHQIAYSDDCRWLDYHLL